MKFYGIMPDNTFVNFLFSKTIASNTAPLYLTPSNGRISLEALTHWDDTNRDHLEKILTPLCRTHHTIWIIMDPSLTPSFLSDLEPVEAALRAIADRIHHLHVIHLVQRNEEAHPSARVYNSSGYSLVLPFPFSAERIPSDLVGYLLDGEIEVNTRGISRYLGVERELGSITH